MARQYTVGNIKLPGRPTVQTPARAKVALAPEFCLDAVPRRLTNKKQFITAVVLFSLMLGFIIVGICVVNEEDKLIEKNPVHSFAIIVDTYVGTKARHFVRYEFVVNSKIYDGHKRYMPHRQPVDIGDTCEIVYAESNPEISRLLTDDNNFLKIQRKK